MTTMATTPAASAVNGSDLVWIWQNGQLLRTTVAGLTTGYPSAAASASDILDMIGTTRGAVLYRGASDWAILPPGTVGQILTANGAGADPTWTSLTPVKSEFTLTASAVTTTVTDALCAATSLIAYMPRSAHAASSVASIWFEPGAGSFTVHHGSNAFTDRTFRYAIL